MDRLEGDNPFTASIPGAQGATLAQIGEVVRGSTIRAIRHHKALSPSGGECVMLELNNGDKLVFVAERTRSLLALDEPTARILPLLLTRRGTRLKH
jgi:hypothetical protein